VSGVMARKMSLMEATCIRQRVMIEAVWPKAGVVREAALLLGGSLFIAVAAQLRIPLPFSPVPVTGQTFAVLLLAAIYGSKRGPAAVMAYLILGFSGLPVFAGGAFGAAMVYGPTAGYLVGFLGAACIVGTLSERGWDRRPWSTAASMIIGNLVIYIAGVAWLSKLVGWDSALSVGVLPFLAGDAIKITFATFLLPVGWKIIGGSLR
jgi:biotin transport system substrate-specific component